MTIAEQITRIKNAKAAIKEAIQNKGVTVSDTAKLDEYPALIDSISVEGSGSDSEYVWPDFFEMKINRTFNGINVGDARYLFSYTCVAEGEEKYKRAIENLDTSNVEYFNYTFYYFCCAYNEGIKELDLTKWDMSNAGYVDYMFDHCGVESINVSGWNFDKTSNLKYFFYSSQIKTINMFNANISKITDMSSFCYNSSNLVSVDMTGCDTSNVKNMSYVFSNCKALTTVIGELDASNLTYGFYPGSMSNPFYKCTSLETVYLKNIYKDCTMTNVAKWSINLSETAVKDECLIYIINELPDLINDKGLTATDKIVFTLPPTNTLTQEQVQVAISKGWQVANTTY